MMTTSAQRLRQKLLDLAIRGKLVPQNPKDEPAEKLLARMREEKSHAEAQSRRGRATSMKSPPSIPDDEKPFDIPSNWVWCRLGEVIELLSGQDFPPSRYSDDVAKGLPYITGASNFGSDGIIENRWTPEPTVISKCGDFLLTCKGSGVGKTAIMNLPEAHIARQIMALRPSEGLDSGYLAAYVRANFDFLRQAANGLIPGIQRSVILSMILPLPPLAEQRRIVVALDALLKEVDAVAAGAKRIATLKDRVRAKILDLAIRGKLVKQDKRDGTADELVRQMRETDICETRPRKPGEKVPLEHQVPGLPDLKLVSLRPKGKIEPVAEDERYFEIPKNWTWVRLSELGVFSGGHTPSLADPKFWDGGDILWVTSKDMKRKYITDTGKKVTKAGAEELGVLPIGTLLMVVRSGILRRTFPIAIAKEPLTINQDQRALQFYFPEVGEYVYAALKGLEHIVLRDYRKTGTTVESIIWEKFINMPIPLPPLAEQQRIVAKVDEMLAACDALTSEA